MSNSQFATSIARQFKSDKKCSLYASLIAQCLTDKSVRGLDKGDTYSESEMAPGPEFAMSRDILYDSSRHVAFFELHSMTPPAPWQNGQVQLLRP